MGISRAPHVVQTIENLGVSAVGLLVADDAVAVAIANEKARQCDSIEMIVSENFVSQAVRSHRNRPRGARLSDGQSVHGGGRVSSQWQSTIKLTR
ncbi:hypothetical protein MUO32_24190 [Shinella sp. CPCC 101442]|nr:hypothetical protein [Shinella sp. CPCC 101442]